MPLSFGPGAPPGPDPVEFSFDEVLLNTWVDDSSVYLQLEADDIAPLEPPPSDQS
jgi:hypothetical protein